MSLDGFIAGPNGEFDWIVADPEVDFAELYEAFDTVLVGRNTYEVMRTQGPGASMPGMQVYVFSSTLKQPDCPGVIVATDLSGVVSALKRAPGKDMWLFGGGALFRSLLELGLVDTVELAVIPVLLGTGLPLLPGAATRTRLRLTGHRVYAKTGTVRLEYDVIRA